MSDKSLKDSPKLPKSSPDDIEDWDDFEEIDLNKKRYRPDSWHEYQQSKILSQSEVLKRFKSVHGDKYDYSKVEYIGKKKGKVLITCPVHGDFYQKPQSHWNGEGCPKCGNIKKGQSQRLTHKSVLERFKSVHGDRYDYSKFEYDGAKTKSEIICSIHGSFQMSYFSHFTMKQGCRKCADEKNTKLHKGRRKYSNEQIINKFREVHGDKYDYSKFEYLGSITKSVVICPTHGEFEVSPSNHLRTNCIKCSREISNTKKLGIGKIKT